MATEAEKMFQSAFDIAKAVFDTPEVKAYYAELGRKNHAAWLAEEARQKREREAAAAEKQRARSYDIWALNGGSDECTQFGIRDGCKPDCPVFQRGECSEQEENEAIFASHLAD